MGNKLTLIQIYFLIAVVYVIASLFHFENLILLSKPALLPILYFLLYGRNKSKTLTICFTFSMSFFIGDVLSLISVQDYYIQSLSFY